MTRKLTTAMELMKLIKDQRSLDPTLMTQQDIADLGGVQKNTVRKWEQNRILPPPVLRLPRWNMPLYDREEVIEELLRHGRLLEADEEE